MKASHAKDPHCTLRQQTVRKPTHVWPCLKTVSWNMFQVLALDVQLFVCFYLDIPVKKTCYSNLSSNEKINCNSTSNPLCYKCTDNRCNSFGRVDHKCLTCSTSTNVNCLQNPKVLQTTRCPAPISDDAYCFVRSVRTWSFAFRSIITIP